MFTFCLLFQRHSCFSNVTVCQAFKLKERDREKEKERERVWQSIKSQLSMYSTADKHQPYIHEVLCVHTWDQLCMPLLSDTALQEQLTLKHLAFTDLALDNSDPFIVAIV